MIPTQSQPIDLRVGSGSTRRFSGRVIRVPVTNAHGAGEAKNVHARLTFLPEDGASRSSFAPREPAQGE
jgi:hypothetical protein